MAHTESKALRARDIAPTGVRLPPDLRDELVRQSSINGRSLSQEITQRLLGSLKATQLQASSAVVGATVVSTGERLPTLAPQISDAHRQLAALFDALTPDKQLALLTLLRR